MIKTIGSNLKFKYLVVCFYYDVQKQEALVPFADKEKTKIYDSLETVKKFPALNVFNIDRFFEKEGKFSFIRLFSAPYRGNHIEIYRF